MRFSTEQRMLRSAIASALHAVALQSTMEVLTGLLLEADDATNAVYVTGYNNEISIRSVVEADIDEVGSLVVPARLFSEIVRKCPDDTIEFSSNEKDNSVVLICGRAKFDLMGYPAKDFPELPMVYEGEVFSLTSEAMRSLIDSVSYATSDDQARPIYQGILFELKGNEVTAVALDGYRVAIKKELLTSSPGKDMSIVIPGKGLVETSKNLEEGEDVTIIAGKRHVQIEMNETTLICRRLEGDFLDWRNLAYASRPIQATLDRKALLASVERISLIINEKVKSPAKLSIQEGIINLVSRTPTGIAKDRCYAEISGDIGEEFSIGFNNRYLLDALRYAPTDELTIQFSSPLEPCAFINSDDKESFTYILLPVRLSA